MKYQISREFGLFAHVRPPICRALLPVMNFLLLLLPKGRRQGVVMKKLLIPSGADGSLTAFLIEPENIDKDAPCLVYCHGGGFVLDIAPTHYELASRYATGAGCKVLLVRYRLAPKYAFPDPLNDCYNAYIWALNNADALGIDKTRTAVAGDSAGGSLAAGTALMARDNGVQMPCFMMLIYPVTDRRMITQSMREYDDTPMWNARLNEKMWSLYLKEESTEDVKYASVAEIESLSGLPDAYIETAEFDCLRDEGKSFAKALETAGSTVELNMTRATMHGFDAVMNSSITRTCIELRVNALRSAFAHGRSRNGTDRPQ